MDSKTYNRFFALERKLNKSCDQLEILIGRIQHLQQRLDSAVNSGHHTIASRLQMELQTVHNVYNMYHKYSSICADEMMLLQQQMSPELSVEAGESWMEE